MEKFVSQKMKRVPGRGILFLVTFPEGATPSTLIGKRVSVDGKVYRCSGLETRGVPRPGDLVCLVGVPTGKKAPNSK